MLSRKENIMGYWSNNGQTHFRQKKLGEMLLETSLIDEGQLQTALHKQHHSRKRLGEIIVRLGFAQEELILGLVGKQLDSPYIKITETEKIDSRILHTIPGNLAQKNLVLPFKVEDDKLWIAMGDPANQFLKKVLSLLTGYNIKSYIASPKELKQAISRYYAVPSKVLSNTKTEKSYFLPLKQLGLTPRQLQLLKKTLEPQRGIILFVGPENSGKKTSLYASLGQLDFPDNDIVCIEKNLDYKFDSVNQISLKDGSPKELSEVLGWVEKFNPNVAAIEGLEGTESWNVAGRMAEKGNLVLATVHFSKNALEFLTEFKLYNLSYTVSENLSLIVFQRLIKEICPFCKVPISLSKTSTKKIGLGNKEVTLFRGKGCVLCDFTGYFNKTACFELVPVTAGLKEALLHGKEISDLKRAIRRDGTALYFEALKHKVLNGQISLDEYIHLTDCPPGRLNEIKVHELTEMLWQAFERSGSVYTYLAYRTKHKNILPFKKNLTNTKSVL